MLMLLKITQVKQPKAAEYASRKHSHMDPATEYGLLAQIIASRGNPMLQWCLCSYFKGALSTEIPVPPLLDSEEESGSSSCDACS